VELSIDTASEVATVALSREGALEAEVTWRCRKNHTVELLPTIERLFEQAGASRGDVSAVFACVGPGMYTGLRVGVSTAQTLAYAMGARVVGVGRLELDAYGHAAYPGRIVAVHRAGRGELAWAAYRSGPWREEVSPRLDGPEEVVRRARGPTLICGEVDEALASAIAARLGEKGVLATPSASLRRAASLAELGYARLSAGEGREAGSLSVVYLRPPALGPRKQ
jgi:tRNA threonylcarbamoyladenosine biosynthesis protein TsaB